MNKRTTIIAVAIIIVTTGIVAAMPVIRKWVTPEPVEAVVEEAPAVSAEELNALETMSRLFHRLDSVKDFEVQGSVTTTDPSDSTGNMTQQYHYARLGTNVYYKIGRQEMFSIPEGNFTVDHLVKKIFIAPLGKTPPSVFPDARQMAAFLTGEGYTVSKSESGNLIWIELKRPNHITCKLYRVGFDEEGLIRETYTRMTDFNDPLNDAKDKTVHAYATRWALGQPPAGKFDISRYLRQRNGAYEAVSNVKDYELIVTR